MLFIAGCAAMGPPGGGPEDKTPPEVLGSNPAPGTTGVSPRADIEIFFSEPVDAATLEASLFIAPTQTERPKVKVHGQRAVIVLPDSIPEVGALTVTIGSGVKDIHGNALASSFSLAVTAGERIPTGQIAGRVYSDAALQGVIVGAWTSHAREEVRPDTLLAPYLTQCGADGYFKLEYLPEGSYRVLAWGDRDGNRKYAPGVDLLALPPFDLTIIEDSVATISLWAAKRDTAEAIPAYASAPDQRHLTVRLTRPPGALLPRFLADAIVKDSLGEDLQVLTGWVDPLDSAKLVFFTATQDSGVNYAVFFQGDTSELSFSASSVPDTSRLKLMQFSPLQGARDAGAQPEGQLVFDDALKEAPSSEAVILMKSDSFRVAVDLHWDAANRISWKASEIVGSGERVKLNVNVGLINDRCGNAGADSIFIIAFETADPATLGSIAGRVSGGDGSDLRVAAKPLDGAKKVAKTALGLNDGTYVIEGLVPGRYIVWTWLDRTKDAHLTLGDLTPFSFSDPFVFHADTLTVRARWQTGGIDLKLP